VKVFQLIHQNVFTFQIENFYLIEIFNMEVDEDLMIGKLDVLLY